MLVVNLNVFNCHIISVCSSFGGSTSCETEMKRQPFKRYFSKKDRIFERPQFSDSHCRAFKKAMLPLFFKAVRA
jgi:hypothetical protein